jgi:glucans biosynthesis protein C
MGSPSRVVRVFEAVSFVPCCAAGCLFMLALFIRFANRHVRVFDVLGDKAYGMYLVHYLFSVWLQFLLLGIAAIAVVKATIVFCGTVALSFGMVAMIQRALTAARDERTRNPGAALPS